MKKRKFWAGVALLSGAGALFLQSVNKSPAAAWWKPTNWSQSSKVRSEPPVPDLSAVTELPTSSGRIEHSTLTWYRPTQTLPASQELPIAKLPLLEPAPTSLVMTSLSTNPPALSTSFDKQDSSGSLVQNGELPKPNPVAPKVTGETLSAPKGSLLPTPNGNATGSLGAPFSSPASPLPLGQTSPGSAGASSLPSTATLLPTFPAVVSSTAAPPTAVLYSNEEWSPTTGPSPEYLLADGMYKPGSRVWLSAEYLLWWLKNPNTPELFATAPGAYAALGTLPDGVTRSALGGTGESLDLPARSGIRVNAGWWFTPEQEVGVEGSWFRLRREALDYRAHSSGDPLLGPSYFDPVRDQSVLVLAAEPNRLRGTVSAHFFNQLWGVDGNFVARGNALFADRFDWLVGYRYVNFREDLLLQTRGTFLPTANNGLANRTISMTDTFSVRNRFHGPQLGYRTEYRFGNWALNFVNKSALGVVEQEAILTGSSTRPNGTVEQGGVLVQRTNQGAHQRARFGFAQEIGLTLNYQVTPGLRTFMGYNLLYMNQIARPTDVLGNVDTQAVPLLRDPEVTRIPTLPAIVWGDHELWAQGITTGFEWRF